jgi:hypothetical protein
MDGSVHEFTKQAGFIFEGTVRRTGAATSPGIEATPTTAVVSVDKVLKGPQVLSRFAGREITVTFGGRDGVPVGARAVFFTNGLHYGEGLAVRAAGYIDADGTEVEREVHEAMERAHDDELLDRLRSARLVVLGDVIRVAPYEHRERIGTEHDPEWWECVIEVASAEKGSVNPDKKKPGKAHITAFFAHSTDVAWYRSPKLDVGDRGVFILHEGEFRKRRLPGPSILLPLDFRPLSDLERLRALVARIQ